MNKKYLALLAAVAVVGAVALMPSNASAEDDEIEIDLSELFSLDLDLEALFGLLGIEGVIDLGTLYLSLEEMKLEGLYLSIVVSLLFGLIEEEELGLGIPELTITWLPPTLYVLFEGFNIMVFAIPVETIELFVSLIPPQLFLEIVELCLISLIPEIGAILSLLFDIPTDVVISLSLEEGLYLFFDAALHILPILSLFGIDLVFDILPAIEFGVPPA
jgi:hypothetical protein